MRWPVFAIFAYLALVLDLGLRTLWTWGGVHPDLVLLLAAFVALWAPAHILPWAMIALGLLIDVTWPVRAAENTQAFVAGPMALGCVVGGYVLFQARPLLMRESVPTMVAAAALMGTFAHLTAVLLLTLRALPVLGGELPGWSAAGELVNRFLQMLYTAALALPVHFVLVRTVEWWGFDGAKGFLHPRPRR